VSPQTFEVYAIKYAERTATRGQVFVDGDPHDAPIDMDYFLWVARTGDESIVIDCGFCREEGERRGRTFLRTPEQALALVGLDPADVHDVVISHMHYDHAGNLDAFPNARFHVNDAEIAYVTGRSMTHKALRHSFRLDDVLEIVRLTYRDRVVFHAGDVDLRPGFSLHHIGGHTPGQLSARVWTERGWVVVASDAAHYYESFLKNRPFTTHESMTEMLEGYRTLRRLGDSEEHVVPGHDPLVLARYLAPAPGLEGAVASLHSKPTREVPT